MDYPSLGIGSDIACGVFLLGGVCLLWFLGKLVKWIVKRWIIKKEVAKDE